MSDIKTRALSKEPVRYRDSHGNTWTAVPGEFNGCFRLPGDPNLYSVKSFAEMIRRSVATVRVVGEGEVIEMGDLQFEDALRLMGEPTPRKLDESLIPKGKKKNVDKIIEYLESKEEGATKKEIADGTGIPIASVNNDVKNPMFEVAGKVGAQNKYRVKK